MEDPAEPSRSDREGSVSEREPAGLEEPTHDAVLRAAGVEPYSCDCTVAPLGDGLYLVTVYEPTRESVRLVRVAA